MCGCKGAARASAVPQTSGDFAAVEAPPDRFAVVSKVEVDPATGRAKVISTHRDYASASQARVAAGGKIRVLRPS